LPFRKKVYKGDLLAKGTAVLLPTNLRQEHQAISDLMNPDKFHGAGANRIIVQEKIEDGFEITAQCLTDGEIIIPLPEVMDFKKRFNEDYEGYNPNTGGKGSFTPVIKVTPLLRANIYQIFEKVVKGMIDEGLGSPPLINLNLKVPDEDHPKVLEINVRFGDPEFEALAMLINFDLLQALKATSQKNQLSLDMFKWRPGFGVAVVLETLEQTNLPNSGRIVDGSLRNWYSNLRVFHSRTEYFKSKVKTTGLGRNLTIASHGPLLNKALENPYYLLNKKQIYIPGSHFRDDFEKYQS